MSDEKNGEITIAAVGDICLGGLFPKTLPHEQIIPVEVKRALSHADIVFGNLESPFSKTGRTVPFGFLCAEPDTVKLLQYIGCNVVNLANNHMADCGYEGILCTLNVLSEYNIQYVGAGANIDDARRPAIFEFPSKGISVAIHGYMETNFENQQAQEFMLAGPRKPGVVPLYHSIVSEDIKNSKTNHDLIIISIHWSEQFKSDIAPWRVKICRELIEEGADIIIGHHPHVLQAYMYYKGGLILGSLGNFYFPSYREPQSAERGIHYWSEEERKSVIAKIRYREGFCKACFIPTLQIYKEDASLLKVAVADEAKSILDKLERLRRKAQSPFYPVHYFMRNVLFENVRTVMRNPQKILRAISFFRRTKKVPRTWRQ